MRNVLLGLALGLVAVPSAVLAQDEPPGFWRASGDIDLWSSYADQKIRETDHSPDGGGVGIGGQLNLPFYTFIEGKYQYNDEDYPYQNSTQGTGYGNSLDEQARLGGGLQAYLPLVQATVYGKVDYVHYRFRSPLLENQYGDIYRAHDNDDGAGFFGGFRTNLPLLVQFYGEGGYLKLSKSRGPEFKGGVALPLGNMFRRRASIELFAEYEWTRLHANSGNTDTFDNFLPGLMYDYRFGVRVPFY